MLSSRLELCASGLYELKYDSSTGNFEREERIFFCPIAHWTNRCFMISFGERGDLYLRRFEASIGFYQNTGDITGHGLSVMTVDGFFVSVIKFIRVTTFFETVISYNYLIEETEISTFQGLKRNQLVWRYESIKFPSTFRFTTVDQHGLPQKGEFFKSAFQDNEGILFVTSNYDTMSAYDILTIQRFYKSNWFFVGNFLIPKVKNRNQIRKRP